MQAMQQCNMHGRTEAWRQGQTTHSVTSSQTALEPRRAKEPKGLAPRASNAQRGDAAASTQQRSGTGRLGADERSCNNSAASSIVICGGARGLGAVAVGLFGGRRKGVQGAAQVHKVPHGRPVPACMPGTGDTMVYAPLALTSLSREMGLGEDACIAR